MTHTPASLLIVDSDYECARMLAAQAEARGYRARTAPAVADVTTLLALEPFDAVLVDLDHAADTGLDLLAQLRRVSTDIEVLVMSDRTSMAATIQWFDPDAFACLRKSDVVPLFAAVARALERRQITAQNRRLVWELQTINDIASGVARSLELDEVLTGAVQRLVGAMQAAVGVIRLRNGQTAEFDIVAAAVPKGPQELARDLSAELTLPSDSVIATGRNVRVEDSAVLSHPARAARLLRSAISVPLLAGDEVLGTLSLGAFTPSRFDTADERLLSTIAGQIVVAIQNARLHQTVRNGKHEWEQIFDVMSDLVAVFDSRSELLMGNRALAEHLSLPITALRGTSCRDVGFCAEKDTCDCGAGRQVASRTARREVTLPNGEIFHVASFPVSLAATGAAVVQVARNVTEEILGARRLERMTSELAGANRRLIAAMDQLKAAQSQLVQSEKLSAIGQLVAGVAHELNNPLTSVIGYAQLVDEALQDGRGSRPSAEIAADVRRITNEAARAAQIVKSFLAFARGQNTPRMPLDIADLCGRVLSLREYEFTVRRIELQTEFPAGLPTVFGDQGLLQQMLLNLVLNAEQAVAGSPVRTLRVSADFDAACGAVELRVTDSGHGIDAENISRVFDPFFTTRGVGEGTGLGLSICHGIIRDHGGFVRVSSTPGGETTFSVTLPARLADPAVASTGVLVANSDPGEREFIAAAFRGWGYPTSVAATPQEALDGNARPGLQLAVVDQAILSHDPEAWRSARAVGVATILTSVAMDDPVPERLAREAGVRVLVHPVELGALHAAVRSGVGQCV